MATYKKPCMHCNAYIDTSVKFCPKCGSRSCFGYKCPTCLATIEKNDEVCSNCKRSLKVECFNCGEMTFVDERCEHCQASLMTICPNPRCHDLQFYQNEKCTSCGKRMKK